MSSFKALPPQTVPAEFVYHEAFNIAHPLTGHEWWGVVKVTSQILSQHGGGIYLRAGKHIGPHNGFGVRQIWEERGHDQKKWAYPTIFDDPRIVSAMIVPASNIVGEFDEMKGYERLIVLSGRKGSVVRSAWPIGEGEI